LTKLGRIRDDEEEDEEEDDDDDDTLACERKPETKEDLSKSQRFKKEREGGIQTTISEACRADVAEEAASKAGLFHQSSSIFVLPRREERCLMK
jgi:hypothetical protein